MIGSFESKIFFLNFILTYITSLSIEHFTKGELHTSTLLTYKGRVHYKVQNYLRGHHFSSTILSYVLVKIRNLINDHFFFPIKNTNTRLGIYANINFYREKGKKFHQLIFFIYGSIVSWLKWHILRLIKRTIYELSKSYINSKIYFSLYIKINFHCVIKLSGCATQQIFILRL